MSNEKIDPKKKDPTISSADDLIKTTKKGDIQLNEEELKRVSGGESTRLWTDAVAGDLSATIKFKYTGKS